MEAPASVQAKTHFEGLLMKMQLTTIDFSCNDKPHSVTVSADSYSAMEPLKMELLRQSLKRGLDDLKSGKVQDGDFVFVSMINAEDK